MSDSGKSSHQKMNYTSIYGIAIFAAIFAPAGLFLNSTVSGLYSVNIYSVAWVATYYVLFDNWVIMLTSPVDWFSFPFALFLRFLFVYQIKRYYDNKTTMNRALLLGLLVECESVFIGILVSLSYYYLVIGIPIPLLLLSALYLMKRNPPEEDPQSWAEESSNEWGPKIIINRSEGD